MTWESFDHSVEDGVARITFNRPHTLNSITFDVYADLVKLTGELAANPHVRVLILGGAGKGFCSGGDVNEIIGPLLQRSQEDVLAFTRMTCQVVKNLRRMPQPVIAAVNGTAAGAGAVLALACDLRICSRTAKFYFLFTKVGLTGADMGTAWLLPRLIGEGRAFEALMFGEPITADQALAWGLANRVVDGDSLDEAAMAWARHLARGPQEALKMTKAAIRAEADMSFESAMEMESVAQAVLLRCRDHREFFDAFVQKRPPQWGREP
jgi:enoyl-CoA hydratase/carnithine racemase